MTGSSAGRCLSDSPVWSDFQAPSVNRGAGYNPIRLSRLFGTGLVEQQQRALLLLSC